MLFLSGRTLAAALMTVSLTAACAGSGDTEGASQSGSKGATTTVSKPPAVPELPGGGTVLFPARRMVALYGTPGNPQMGVLGEQGVEDSITRVKALTNQYRDLTPEHEIPAFEIISTVALGSPGRDGTYSRAVPLNEIRPWVEAAAKAGVYVVLDLQPGRSDFLTQAKLFEEFLKLPHVGLALDPEWRLQPDQYPLQQIGQVGVDEVNSVIDWLADLTKANNLPQKLFIVHQFQQRMIIGRERIDTSRSEIAVAIHADGHGTPGEKMETWNDLLVGLPPGVRMAWKNFYDEDKPTFSPESTVAVDPRPWFVSYQ
ncbi:MAG: hypothetical protein LLG14_18955 [Nocardiaceae bacterium]|nr:hypothetical protein [Nocardiaceae bacterium]